MMTSSQLCAICQKRLFMVKPYLTSHKKPHSYQTSPSLTLWDVQKQNYSSAVKLQKQEGLETLISQYRVTCFSDIRNKRKYSVDNSRKFKLPEAEYDWEYLTNPVNNDKIQQNIQHRKGVGDIGKLVSNYGEHIFIYIILIFLTKSC